MRRYEDGISTREKVYKIVKKYIKENGYSPTVREIQQLIGLKSVATVAGHLDMLQKQGYITRISGASRTIRINEEI